MTEEEAKTKWCPFSRVSVMQDGAVAYGAPVLNRIEMHRKNSPEYPVGSMCIGSACMAWRRARETVDPKTLSFLDRPVFGNVTKESDSQGYCGLAGKPLI